MIVGLLTFIGLSILDIKYALMLSIVAAIFELIPFGIILAAIPAIIFARHLAPGLRLPIRGCFGPSIKSRSGLMNSKIKIDICPLIYVFTGAR